MDTTSREILINDFFIQILFLNGYSIIAFREAKKLFIFELAKLIEEYLLNNNKYSLLFDTLLSFINKKGEGNPLAGKTDFCCFKKRGYMFFLRTLHVFFKDVPSFKKTCNAFCVERLHLYF